VRLPTRKLALILILALSLLGAGTASAANLKTNRNRLFADWAARKGYSNVCQAWSGLSHAAKGAFLTLTNRLQISYLADGTVPLDHVTALYSILGDPDNDCGGGDDNRIFVSMDDYLWSAMAYANLGYVTTIDANGNSDWGPSSDLAGPHSPFDASDETAYGHPCGQVHFWITDDGYYYPVCRADLNCRVDANMLEMDQDYDWNHPSSTECSYDTGGCDQCEAGTNRAGFSDGTGRMIYDRQHPGANYDWTPTGCEKSWCNGARTCEAQTASGYLLGYPATTCSQVPCTSTTPADYYCTLDGVKKSCSNGSWVRVS
jgi:hypothetical protein